MVKNLVNAAGDPLPNDDAVGIPYKFKQKTKQFCVCSIAHEKVVASSDFSRTRKQPKRAKIKGVPKEKDFKLTEPS